MSSACQRHLCFPLGSHIRANFLLEDVFCLSETSFLTMLDHWTVTQPFHFGDVFCLSETSFSTTLDHWTVTQPFHFGDVLNIYRLEPMLRVPSPLRHDTLWDLPGPLLSRGDWDQPPSSQFPATHLFYFSFTRPLVFPVSQ
jgi:hypothetical protein